MAKVKNFKTIFPAVSVPLNADYTINEPEFRAYLRWTTKASKDWSAMATPVKSPV